VTVAARKDEHTAPVPANGPKRKQGDKPVLYCHVLKRAATLAHLLSSGALPPPPAPPSDSFPPRPLPAPAAGPSSSGAPSPPLQAASSSLPDVAAPASVARRSWGWPRWPRAGASSLRARKGSRDPVDGSVALISTASRRVPCACLAAAWGPAGAFEGRHGRGRCVSHGVWGGCVRHDTQRCFVGCPGWWHSIPGLRSECSAGIEATEFALRACYVYASS
jgi:hypothetical protein